jgi:hypothetical protein
LPRGRNSACVQRVAKKGETALRGRGGLLRGAGVRLSLAGFYRDAVLTLRAAVTSWSHPPGGVLTVTASSGWFSGTKLSTA